MVADCTFHLVAKTTRRMWGHRKVAVEVSPGTLSLGLWGRETQALGQRSVGCVSTFWTKAFADRYLSSQGFPDSSVGKGSACNAGDPSLVPRLGRSPGEGIGYPQCSWASLMAQLVKNPPAMWETWVWSLSWKDWSPGEGKGYPLQYSGLENSGRHLNVMTPVFNFQMLFLRHQLLSYMITRRNVWWVHQSEPEDLVHGVTKSGTWLSDFHFHLFTSPVFPLCPHSGLHLGFLFFTISMLAIWIYCYLNDWSLKCLCLASLNSNEPEGGNTHTHTCSKCMISEILFIFHCFPLSSYYICLWQIKAALQTCRQTWHLRVLYYICCSQRALGRVLPRLHQEPSICAQTVALQGPASPAPAPSPSCPFANSSLCAEGKRPDGFWPPLMYFYLWVLILNRKWGLLSWEKVREDQSSHPENPVLLSEDKKVEGLKGSCWWKVVAAES